MAFGYSERNCCQPNTNNTVCNINPLHKPNTNIITWRREYCKLRVITKSKSGPGERVNKTLETKKRERVSIPKPKLINLILASCVDELYLPKIRKDECRF